MTYKHKTHAVDVDGKIVSNADVDFYIDDVWLFISFSYFLFLLVWLLGNLHRSGIVQGRVFVLEFIIIWF